MHETPPRPRRRLAALLTVAVLVLTLVAVFRRSPAPHEDAATGEHIPALGPHAVTLLPGLHLLGGLAPAAAYVVETSDGLVLIDAGLDRDAGLLKREMATLGLDWRRVRAIFLTHVHGDHCGGAEHLRTAT